jgi:hypothetical protein
MAKMPLGWTYIRHRLHRVILGFDMTANFQGFASDHLISVEQLLLWFTSR